MRSLNLKYLYQYVCGRGTEGKITFLMKKNKQDNIENCLFQFFFSLFANLIFNSIW